MTEKLENNFHKKLYGLDHLRAFAIILVFFFHYYIVSDGKPEWLPKVASFGWTGVDLFFVLSGFLISSQLFSQIKNGQLISFKVFFIKRFFRIVPAYLVTVAIYFIKFIYSGWCLCEDLLTYKVSIFGFPLIAIGFSFMVVGAISPTSFLFKINSKISTFIASLSFAIYLTHKGIIHTTHQLLKDFEIADNLMLIICIITSVLGAYILHLVIEKPFMKIRNRFIKEK
jgi:peptidoglycan/LPS O-acetylase OafA/YrhL